MWCGALPAYKALHKLPAPVLPTTTAVLPGVKEFWEGVVDNLVWH